MEPDNPNIRPASLVAHPASASAAAVSRASPSNPDPNRGMPSFAEAVNTLRQHSFKDTANFGAACVAARSAYRDTFLSINSADISNLQAARDQLHYSDNFLAYISTLHASLAAVEPSSPLVPHLIADYRRLVVETPAAWVKAVPVRWVGVSRHAARLAIESHDIPLALSLIRPLRDAANKSAPAPDFLVPIQADFLAVCLEARCYSLAASWIREHRRLNVDVEATALSGTDVHLIHHYSAMVFIGVKDFRTALQCCRLALCVPALSPASIYDVILSTFKVFVMLHLLVVGKAPSMLKFSSHQTTRMRKAASEYMELAYAFEKRDCKQLQQIVESNRELFEKQGNLGLVKQVVVALSKHVIVRLTKSFVTMKMKDVAARAGLRGEEEAHAVILELIRCKRINASIDDRKGVVRLMDNDVAEEESMASKLSAEYMDDCVNIVQRIEVFRENLETDPNYLMKEYNAQPGKRAGRYSRVKVAARDGERFA